MKKVIKKLVIGSLCFCVMVGITVSASAARATTYSDKGHSVSSAAAVNFQLNAYTWGTPIEGTPVKAYQNISGDNSQRWQLYDRYIRNAESPHLVVTKSGSGTILNPVGNNDKYSKITSYNNGQGYDAYILWSFELASDPVSTMLQLDGYYNGANIGFSRSNGSNNQRWYINMYY